jgi:hypothetical protein
MQDAETRGLGCWASANARSWTSFGDGTARTPLLAVTSALILRSRCLTRKETGASIRESRTIDTYTQELSHVDRAILEGETQGFVRVHTKKGTDSILGATIVAANAGDMICELTLALTQGLGLKKIADTIHPYPTQAEAIRKVGDVYNRSRLTPLVNSMFRKWFAWTR